MGVTLGQEGIISAEWKFEQVKWFIPINVFCLKLDVIIEYLIGRVNNHNLITSVERLDLFSSILCYGRVHNVTTLPLLGEFNKGE